MAWDLRQRRKAIRKPCFAIGWRRCLREVTVLRILVLDDESLIAMMLAVWLQEMGHEVAGPVATAGEALAVIDTTGVDAALIDLHLRDGNSYAVAARLRS